MSLPTGVRKARNRFRTGVKVQGKEYHMGTYGTVEDAEMVYKHSKKLATDLVERLSEPEIVIEFPEYVRVEKPSWLQLIFGKKKNTSLE